MTRTAEKGSERSLQTQKKASRLEGLTRDCNRRRKESQQVCGYERTGPSEKEKGSTKRQTSTTVDDHQEEDTANSQVVSAEKTAGQNFVGEEFRRASTATSVTATQEQQPNMLLESVDEACNPPSGASTLITAETPGEECELWCQVVKVCGPLLMPLTGFISDRGQRTRPSRMAPVFSACDEVWMKEVQESLRGWLWATRPEVRSQHRETLLCRWFWGVSWLANAMPVFKQHCEDAAAIELEMPETRWRLDREEQDVEGILEALRAEDRLSANSDHFRTRGLSQVLQAKPSKALKSKALTSLGLLGGAVRSSGHSGKRRYGHRPLAYRSFDMQDATTKLHHGCHGDHHAGAVLGECALPRLPSLQDQV
eukprot:s2811_g6.t1